MPRRRLLLIVAAVCLLLAVPFVVRWAMTPVPGVTNENFKRLHTGMTLEEMEAILGERAELQHVAGMPVHTWTGKDSGVSVIENAPGYMVGWHFRNGYPIAQLASPPDPLLTKIRRWLGL